jgi:predicted transcriptional regulator
LKEAIPMAAEIQRTEIIKPKYVVCLECGKKFKTLKVHLIKAHGLAPQEYYQKHGLDPEKFPLICKEYSKKLSEQAQERARRRKLVEKWS